MSWFNNSFSPMVGPNDIKIEFDGNVFFQVIDSDTGEETYLKIDCVIGQETKEVPKVGDYILSEERIIDKSKALVAEPEIVENKKGLWDEEFNIDLEEDSQEQSLLSWDEVIDRFCKVGEVYPITVEEVKEALSLTQNGVFEASGIDQEVNMGNYLDAVKKAYELLEKKEEEKIDWNNNQLL